MSCVRVLLAAAAWVGLGFCGWVFHREGLTDHDAAVAIRSLDCTKFLPTFRSDLLTLAPSSPSQLYSRNSEPIFLVQIADFAASACTCESRRTGILGKILYHSTVFTLYCVRFAGTNLGTKRAVLSLICTCSRICPFSSLKFP